jgi:hypothetical protein
MVIIFLILIFFSNNDDDLITSHKYLGIYINLVETCYLSFFKNKKKIIIGSGRPTWIKIYIQFL